MNRGWKTGNKIDGKISDALLSAQLIPIKIVTKISNTIFMKNKYLIYYVFILSILGCKPETKLDEKQVYEEMMDIHNKVMPKMSEVNAVKRDLMDFNHNLDENSLTVKDSVLNTIMKLSDTEDRMSDWMDAISERNKKIVPAAMLAFLKNEKDTITTIENDVLLNLATARELLKTSVQANKTH